MQIALYRITQEALNNIDKHAQANAVTVCVNAEHSRVILEITDDGIGFLLDKIGATSFGLDIMRERAEAIGASITINSELEHGTQIRITWEKDGPA